MKRRTASDRMAECIIEMVHEYKQAKEFLNHRVEILEANVDHWKDKTKNAVEQCDKATDTLGEIADIIAGFTEHTDDGYIKVYLSNLMPENAVKLERLFKLLDIPMTADHVNDSESCSKCKGRCCDEEN